MLALKVGFCRPSTPRRKVLEFWENAGIRGRAAELEKSFLYSLTLEGRRKAILAEPPKIPNLLLYHISADLSRGLRKKNFAQISFLKSVQIDGNSYLLLDVNEIYSKVNLISLTDGNFYLFWLSFTTESIVADEFSKTFILPSLPRSILKPQSIILGKF